MLKPNIYKKRDEIAIDANKYKFYYGENEIDPISGEWCFVVYKNSKEVFRTSNSQLLDVAQGESPSDLVIAGMSLYFSRL